MNWNEAIVKRWWPTRSASEIEQAYGIPSSTSRKIASRLGIAHGGGTAQRLEAKREANLQASRQADPRRAAWGRSHAKAIKKREARRRLDQWRAWEGKPTRYRYPVAAMGRKARQSRRYLIACRGYEPCPSDPLTLWRTAATRPAKHEARIAGRHGFNIIDKPQGNDG